jgi:hypothetical protein
MGRHGENLERRIASGRECDWCLSVCVSRWSLLLCCIDLVVLCDLGLRGCSSYLYLLGGGATAAFLHWHGGMTPSRALLCSFSGGCGVGSSSGTRPVGFGEFRGVRGPRGERARAQIPCLRPPEGERANRRESKTLRISSHSTGRTK